VATKDNFSPFKYDAGNENLIGTVETLYWNVVVALY